MPTLELIKRVIHRSTLHFAVAGSTVYGSNRELKQTATATATGTLLNKRFNEQNNSCARAL